MSFSLPTTITAMDASVQEIVNSLPQSHEGAEAWNAAQAWAPVATSFFSSAGIPAMTELGKSAGELAFISACQASTGTTNTITQQSLSAGFTAYAAAAVVPGNCLPAAPIAHAPPVAPLVLNLSAVPAATSSLSSTEILHTQLSAWAVTGTQTTPGAPPVVVPWL